MLSPSFLLAGPLIGNVNTQRSQSQQSLFVLTVRCDVIYIKVNFLNLYTDRFSTEFRNLF